MMITTVGPYAKYGRPVVQVNPITLITAGSTAHLISSVCVTKTCSPSRTMLPQLQACVENGTHYCDLTGEALFIRRMMEEFHEEARAKGVRIVNSCGFDSVPGDALSLMAAHHMKQQHNKKLAETTVFVDESVISILVTSFHRLADSCSPIAIWRASAVAIIV